MNNCSATLNLLELHPVTGEGLSTLNDLWTETQGKRGNMGVNKWGLLAGMSDVVSLGMG